MTPVLILDYGMVTIANDIVVGGRAAYIVQVISNTIVQLIRRFASGLRLHFSKWTRADCAK